MAAVVLVVIALAWLAWRAVAGLQGRRIVAHRGTGTMTDCSNSLVK